MPVFFYIDPEFAADWNCRNINDITLSYTFHKVRSRRPGALPPMSVLGIVATISTNSACSFVVHSSNFCTHLMATPSLAGGTSIEAGS